MIKIINRLGTFQIKSRLVPFNLIIINENGAQVGQKTFSDVQDNYIWDSVYLVGRVVRVELQNNNYLSMAEVEVWGEEAVDCPTYQTRYNELNQRINQSLINYSTVPTDLNVQRDRLKTLADSCMKLTPQDQTKRQELITEQAQAYDNVLALQEKENQATRDEAEQQLANIKVAQQQEQIVANQAKQLGLPPPPPRYTASEIAEVNDELKNTYVRPLTTEQKAQCMGLLNDATEKRSKAEDLGRISEFMPALIASAQSASADSEEAWKKYNSNCT
jgi:hypothetical protein